MFYYNYAYTALNSIILFLFPRSVVAYTSLQIFLSVLAIAAIFRMLIGIWKMDPVKAFVGTLVISFIPIFYGSRATYHRRSAIITRSDRLSQNRNWQIRSFFFAWP